MSIYLDLFLTFAKVGVTTFGGGPAMLPILQREIVDNKGWATEEELADYYAIGQCTPGIIAVNTATFIGKKKAGIWGGIIATLGIVFPSIVIITILAQLIENFSDIEWVKHAFSGIRVCVCVLVVNAVIRMSKKALIDIPTVIIFLIAFLGTTFLPVTPIIYVVLAAIAGILLQVKKQ